MCFRCQRVSRRMIYPSGCRALVAKFSCEASVRCACVRALAQVITNLAQKSKFRKVQDHVQEQVVTGVGESRTALTVDYLVPPAPKPPYASRHLTWQASQDARNGARPAAQSNSKRHAQCEQSWQLFQKSRADEIG